MAFGKVAVLVALSCVLAQGQNLTQSALPELKQRAPFGVGNFFFGLEPPLQVSLISQSDLACARPSGPSDAESKAYTVKPSPALRVEYAQSALSSKLRSRSNQCSQTRDPAISVAKRPQLLQVHCRSLYPV